MSVDLLNMDCMDYLRECEDNAFDLAIVDPPYGLRRFQNDRPTSRLDKYGGHREWNNAPIDHQYFDELQRVAIQQIVWGGNYFPQLPISQGWIFWDKKQPAPSFAAGELAWSSFDTPLKKLSLTYYGPHGADTVRIHPSQKPVKLYDWLLTKYAKPGQRILDTHLGSGSSAIAAHYFGADFVGIEIDEDYYKAACERFEKETAQLDLLA